MTKTFRPLLLSLFFVAIVLGASRSAYATATIVILNNDAANFGFNDTTAAAPVGGNNGTTLGQQRLNAFQAAADKWGATIDSPITITIRAQWAAQTCTATAAVLGSAGAIGIFRDFPGFPFASTWYNESLGSKLFGSDLNATQPEINATFNINLGQPGCLTGTFFYLGLDGNHGTNVDLVTVLLHEFAHGLGFQTFTNAQTGAQNSGFPAIYDRFLMDISTGKSWLQMTNAERAASSINTHKLVWNGPQVQADVPSVLTLGEPGLTINSPAGIAGAYDPASVAYNPAPPVGGVTGNLKLADDGTAPVTDGCEPFPADFFAGQIAVIDRGTCSIKSKTLAAQNAGAIAVIIVNNAAGSPAPDLGDDPAITTPITISTISVTQADGNTIKAQLGTGVNATIFTDPNIRAGADQFGKALLYTPIPFNGGSSVSHWATTMRPNQLMEPNISSDLTHEVTPPIDLTFSQLRDIGWVASAIPTAIVKTGGDNQNTALSQPFSTPLSVTVSPAIAGITVTWTANAGGSGANGSFPGTGRSAISVTDASGVATAPTLTANGSSGFFSVNATAPGAGTTTFSVLIDPAPVAGDACLTDTTQADFAAGTTNNTDVNASPGNVVLLNPANPDQSQTVASTSGTGFNTTQWLGQTFVPSVTGKLQRINMALFCASCSGTDQPITVEVRTTTGSPALPTSTVLATTTLPGFNSGASSTFTATFATPATLTAGTTYAYTLRLVTNRTGTYAAVFGNAPTDYPNGDRVVSTTSGGTWTVPTSSGTFRDLVFTTYMQTGNAPSGDYVSSLKDSNPPVAGTTQWGTLSWNATVPANTTLQFQAAASNSFGGPFNFVGPDGTSGTFFTNGASLAQFNGFRYLKYKALFTTSDNAVTPTLNDVTICYFNKQSQTISFGALADKTYGDADFQVTATATSGLPVSFSASGNCTVTGDIVHLTGAGSCTITASQAGDASYAPAANVQQTFNIAKAGTTTALVSNVNPSGLGQLVTFTATVTDSVASDDATGTVDFIDTSNANAVICDDVALTAGQAQCQTSTLTTGAHDIQAVYSGAANFATSTSNTLQQLVLPVLRVLDAKAAEPATGSSRMLFTVVLSAPAGAAGVTVNYATADDTVGANPATSGTDYTPVTSTSLTFQPGETVKVVAVDVLHDTDAGETDETFLLQLSGAAGAAIGRATATGTITPNETPGTLIISELRTRGPGGSGDEFVELYNNTDSPLTVNDASGGYGVYKLGAGCDAAPVLVGVVPNGTVIAARGHYLLVGSAYSLGSYAAGDLVMTSDIEDDANVGLFTTASVADVSSANRLDAVGFGGNAAAAAFSGKGTAALRKVRAPRAAAATAVGMCDLLREGNNLGAVTGTTTEHTFVRKQCDFVSAVGCLVPGNSKDTNDNASDFLFASTDGNPVGTAGQRLGAPGPESMASPIRRDNSGVSVTLLDSTKSSSAEPNRHREFTAPGYPTFGTLSIRRRVTNVTGSPVTRLRVRIVEMTTHPTPGGGQADLRAITSAPVAVMNINDAGTCSTAPTPCTLTVEGTTLEAPPAQPNGGGYNATLSLPTPLANNAAVNVQFLLGIETPGTFRFYIIVEALP